MAHYRKIDVSIWNDEKFSSLKLPSKMAFIFLITHPNMTGIGAMRATIPGLSAELGVSPKDFQDVLDKGMAIHSAEECCVFVPKFIEYQGCDSLNVLKGWVKQLEYVPAGKTKDNAVANLFAYIVGNAEAKALAKGLGKEEAINDAFVLAFKEAYAKANGKPFALAKAYPVSSKQLAVSKPPLPSQEKGKGVDESTGEILWVAK